MKISRVINRFIQDPLHQLAILIMTGLILVGYIAQSYTLFNLPHSQEFLNTLVSYDGTHTTVRIYISINGELVRIPGDINHIHHYDRAQIHESGIQTWSGNMQEVHYLFFGTVTNKDLLLKNFFRVWNHPFTRFTFMGHSRLLGTLEMYVNGIPNDSFENYIVQPQDVIYLEYNSWF